MELTPDILLRAYAIGIFPMAEGREHRELHWIDPEQRGVLPLDSFHVPRKLRRRIRRGDFKVTCDNAFAKVIESCAEPADNRPDTWINPAIEHLVMELHAMGFAHSIECWRDDRLLGGLYGVSLGGCFFGESMFSREKDASKIALVHLVFRMKKGGFVLLDTQFTTPHLTQFGVIDISRADYRELLGKAINLPAEFPLAPFSMAEIADYLDKTA